MTSTNPYASPQTPRESSLKKPEKEYRSLAHAALAGACRGAIVGGTWMAIIVGGLEVVLVFATIALVVPHDMWFKQAAWPEIIKGIGLLAAAVVVCSGYAAVLGALIMSAAAAIVYRKAATKAEGEKQQSIGHDGDA